MPEQPPRQTLADYVTIAISPLLLMALIGSLVFFLLEVVYVGQYSGRLQWTLFFFVFAMVLVGRIAIELGSERASLYGLAMAAVTFIALQGFVEYPSGTPLASFGWAINLGFIGLIWWCANRLTWDCTHIDDAVTASGQGVLQAAGLEAGPGGPEAEEEPAEPLEEPAHLRTLPGILAWWERYRLYQKQVGQRPHTPGVWVVYFSLAALPLFGLGQSLIPASDAARRRYVFWLMVCYVGSGLGLLLTTSFLGLRRYLRQRKLQMPAAMTGIWLSLGAGLIAVLLLVGALLPRPYGEYQVVNFRPLGDRQRQASKYAVKRDSAAKGKGRGSGDPTRRDPNAQSGRGTQPDKQGGQGRSTAQGGKGSSGKSGSGKGSQGNQQGGRQGKSSRSNDSSKSDAKDRSDRSQQAERQDQSRDPNDREGANDENQRDQEENKQDADSGSGSDSDSPGENASEPPGSSLSGLFEKLGWLGTILKWLLFAVLAIGFIGFLCYRGLHFLAKFTNWARQLLAALQALWASLFGSRAPAPEVEERPEEEHRPRPRPFAAFSNPFLDGRAESLSPDELTRYSFEALEAWAWEHDWGRQPEETPIEFATRLSGAVPSLAADARGVAGLYARVAYARGRLTTAALGRLRQFWDHLEAVAESRIPS